MELLNEIPGFLRYTMTFIGGILTLLIGYWAKEGTRYRSKPQPCSEYPNVMGAINEISTTTNKSIQKINDTIISSTREMAKSSVTIQTHMEEIKEGVDETRVQIAEINAKFKINEIKMSTLGEKIEDHEKEIEENKKEIEEQKKEIAVLKSLSFDKPKKKIL